MTPNRPPSPRRAWVYLGLAALALAIGYYATLPQPLPPSATPSAAASGVAAAPAPAVKLAKPAATTAVAAAPPDDPTADWQAFTRFKERTQSFLRDGSRLAPEQRRDEAAALSEQVRRYGEDRHLAGGEAMMLEVALARIAVDDPAELKSAVDAIAARYKLAAEQAAQAAAEPDPRFLDYKAREKEIVARVMAMNEIPGGLDRNEYLRQELQTAREEAYRR